MAVAFGGTKSIGASSGSTGGTSSSWALSGSNIVIVIHIGCAADPGSITCSWSNGGTSALVKSQDSGTAAYGRIYAIPVGSTNTGTYTVTLTNSVANQISADYFTGADQTTPCPTADAWSSTVNNQTPITSSVTNLTANDATAALGINTVTGNPTGVTPNQTYLNSTTAVNMETGYATGTTQVSLNNDTQADSRVWIAARVAAAGAGGNSSSVSPSVSPSVSASVSRSPSPSASLSPSASQSPSSSVSPSPPPLLVIQRTVLDYID